MDERERAMGKSSPFHSSVLGEIKSLPYCEHGPIRALVPAVWETPSFLSTVYLYLSTHIERHLDLHTYFTLQLHTVP